MHSVIRKIPFIIVLALIIFAAAFLISFLKDNGIWVNQDSTAVVKEIKELQRLETAQFTIEKIIDAGTEGNRFQELLFGDALLLIAHGEVIAGFDMAKLEDRDIEIRGNAITLKLPPPEILVSKINGDKTRVYDRDQGLLTRGNKDLETLARADAEKQIRMAACESGILDTAATNGHKQLTALLSSFGFETVTIQIPDASC
jgi:hypothetical protein